DQDRQPGGAHGSPLRNGRARPADRALRIEPGDPAAHNGARLASHDMRPDDVKSLNTRATVLAYAVGATLVISTVNVLLMVAGVDDGSAADYVRGAFFIAITTV